MGGLLNGPIPNRTFPSNPQAGGGEGGETDYVCLKQLRPWKNCRGATVTNLGCTILLDATNRVRPTDPPEMTSLGTSGRLQIDLMTASSKSDSYVTG